MSTQWAKLRNILREMSTADFVVLPERNISIRKNSL